MLLYYSSLRLSIAPQNKIATYFSPRVNGGELFFLEPAGGSDNFLPVGSSFGIPPRSFDGKFSSQSNRMISVSRENEIRRLAAIFIRGVINSGGHVTLVRILRAIHRILSYLITRYNIDHFEKKVNEGIDKLYKV